MAMNSHGLTLLPKLKREHIQLTSYSKMRVDLAAQVCITFFCTQSGLVLGYLLPLLNARQTVTLK